MNKLENLSTRKIDLWLEAINKLIEIYSRYPQNSVAYVKEVEGVTDPPLCSVADRVYLGDIPSCLDCLWYRLDKRTCEDKGYEYTKTTFGERIKRLKRWKEILLEEKKTRQD